MSAFACFDSGRRIIWVNDDAYDVKSKRVIFNTHSLSCSPFISFFLSLTHVKKLSTRLENTCGDILTQIGTRSHQVAAEESVMEENAVYGDKDSDKIFTWVKCANVHSNIPLTNFNASVLIDRRTLRVSCSNLRGK